LAALRTGSLGVLTTKGDLLATDVAGDLDRLPVGSDGQLCSADAASPLGIKYIDPSALSGVGPAETFVFGADIGSNTEFYLANGDPGSGTVAALNTTAELVIEYACKLDEFSWSTEFAAAGGSPTRWQIYKNGVALGGEIITTVGATGTNTPKQGAQSLSSTTFAKGDRIAVQQLDGTIPKQGVVRVAVVTP